MDAQREINILTDCETFIYAFKLGAKLMLDVLENSEMREIWNWISQSWLCSDWELRDDRRIVPELSVAKQARFVASQAQKTWGDSIQVKIACYKVHLSGYHNIRSHFLRQLWLTGLAFLFPQIFDAHRSSKNYSDDRCAFLAFKCPIDIWGRVNQIINSDLQKIHKTAVPFFDFKGAIKYMRG